MFELKKPIPIRLSHSSLETLHTCERKWQQDKLLVNEQERDETEHTVYGRAFGTGCATYLVTQDADMALWQAWFAYTPELESDKKSMTRCMVALMRSFPALDTLLDDYEVATFNDKPAVELSFRLNITPQYYFVGHIDVILRHKYTGIHYVMDAKHTGLLLHDLSPLYQNSGQCLGYSIALDRIVGEKQSSYGVLYFVSQLGKGFTDIKTHVLPYQKTLVDRLKWFMTLGLDVKKLEDMESLNVYPMRGHSCLKYNRPCKYFGTCGLHSLDVLKEREEDTIEYDFVYELDELITEHMARIPTSKLEETL